MRFEIPALKKLFSLVQEPLHLSVAYTYKIFIMCLGRTRYHDHKQRERFHASRKEGPRTFHELHCSFPGREIMITGERILMNGFPKRRTSPQLHDYACYLITSLADPRDCQRCQGGWSHTNTLFIECTARKNKCFRRTLNLQLGTFFLHQIASGTFAF